MSGTVTLVVQQGRPIVEAKGFSGSSCVGPTRAVARQLGVIATEEATAERYSGADVGGGLDAAESLTVSTSEG